MVQHIRLRSMYLDMGFATLSLEFRESKVRELTVGFSPWLLPRGL